MNTQQLNSNAPIYYASGGILLLLLLLLTYGPAMQADFVWDDQHLIVHNRLLHDGPLLELLFSDLWAGSPEATLQNSGYFRPLLLLDFKLDYLLFGLNSTAWHIHSFIWHSMGCVLFYAFLLRTSLSVHAAFIGSVLFALHPLAVESVMFISARNDLMAFVLIMASALMFDDERPAPWRLFLGGLFVLLACLSKEMAYLTPYFIGVLAWQKSGKWLSSSFYVAVISVSIALVIRFAFATDAPSFAVQTLSGSDWRSMLSHYASVIFWPFDIAPGAHVSGYQEHLWLIALLPLLLFMWPTSTRKSLAAITLALIGFLPSIFGILQTGFLPDRYMYFPLAGLGYVLTLMFKDIKNIKISLFAVGSILTLALSTRHLADKWQTELKLFSYGFQVHKSAPISGMLAKTLEQNGRFEEAAERYEAAIGPGHTQNEHACWNVTSAHLKAFEKTGSKKHLRSAIRFGEGVLGTSCESSIELISPILFSRALLGDWDNIEPMVQEISQDPTGRLVILKVALGARRRTFEPVDNALEAKPDGDPFTLLTMAAKCLSFSGDTQSANWLLLEGQLRFPAFKPPMVKETGESPASD